MNNITTKDDNDNKSDDDGDNDDNVPYLFGLPSKISTNIHINLLI